MKEFNLHTMRDDLEVRLNKWANEIAHNYRIPQGSFRIRIEHGNAPRVDSRDHFPIISRVSNNGAVVQINIVMPYIKEKEDFATEFKRAIRKMKVTIKRILDYISDPRKHQDEDFFNPLAISNIEHIYSEVSPSVRKWTKRKFDPYTIRDTSRREFKLDVQRVTTVTMTHKKTGISYTIKDKENRREHDLIQECWEKCAELIAIETESVPSPNVALVLMDFYENQAVEWLALTIQPERWVH